MKDIIQKAIEGGWMITDRMGEAQEWHELHPINENPERIICDPLFWQALFPGKNMHVVTLSGNKPIWVHQSLKFHEINLTEGWNKAVEYLENLIKS